MVWLLKHDCYSDIEWWEIQCFLIWSGMRDRSIFLPSITVKFIYEFEILCLHNLHMDVHNITPNYHMLKATKNISGVENIFSKLLLNAKVKWHPSHEKIYKKLKCISLRETNLRFFFRLYDNIWLPLKGQGFLSIWLTQRSVTQNILG